MVVASVNISNNGRVEVMAKPVATRYVCSNPAGNEPTRRTYVILSCEHIDVLNSRIRHKGVFLYTTI